MTWSLVDFLQALAAGLLVGGTYGLMCVGLGIIFGVMRVVNFAHGDFMMLGMYIAFYLVGGFGVLAFMGPYAAPIAGAILAGAIVSAFGLWFQAMTEGRGDEDFTTLIKTIEGWTGVTVGDDEPGPPRRSATPPA